MVRAILFEIDLVISYKYLGIDYLVAFGAEAAGYFIEDVVSDSLFF